MAGMLPGVECARRRRFHQSSAWSDSPTTPGYAPTRRPSFCLYTSNYETHLASTSSTHQRNPIRHLYLDDEKLDEAAREAKERLDERLRLRAQSKSESKRTSNNGLQRSRDFVAPQGDVHVRQRHVFRLKKSGSKRFSWAKLSSKSSEQDDCAVCLDQFKPGETLMHLPCAHRFHSKCLLPWLESNAHCPCCRMETATLLCGSHRVSSV